MTKGQLQRVGVAGACLVVAGGVVAGCGGGSDAPDKPATHARSAPQPAKSQLPTSNLKLYYRSDRRNGTPVSFDIENGGRLTVKDVQVQVTELTPNGKAFRLVTPVITSYHGTTGDPSVTSDGRVDLGEIPSGWDPSVVIKVPRLGDPRSKYALGGTLEVFKDGQRVGYRDWYSGRPRTSGQWGSTPGI